MADPRRVRGARRLHRQARPRLGAPVKGERAVNVAAVVSRCEALFEDVSLGSVKAWKEGAAGRKAIGYMPIYVPREIIHAAGMLPVGHLRRRRSHRGDPGRRLLPELHLPHPAIDDRARRHGAPRLPRRHAVPVDLRRDPEPLGHVEDHVPRRLRAATSTCRRTTRTPSAAPSASASWRRSARTWSASRAGGSRTTICAPRSRSTTTTAGRSAISTPTARSKPWQAPTAEVYLVMRAGLVLPVEEHTRSSCASTSPPRTPSRGRSATTPAWCSRASSASSRRSGSSSRSSWPAATSSTTTSCWSCAG